MAGVKRERALRLYIQMLFLLYILVLLKITLFKYVTLDNIGGAFYSMERDYSYIPFRQTLYIIKNTSVSNIIRNIAGNIIIFIPFGWLLPLVTPFEKETAVYGLILSVAIELSQFVFCMGFADVDNLIYNTLGAYIGYRIYRFIRGLIESQKGIMAFFAIVTTIGVSAAVLLIYYDGTLI